MKNFWWGQRQQEAKLSWISRKRMCNSKANGELGFKNLKAFNLAILAKQAWRILTNQSSLVARVLKVSHG